MIEPGEIKPSRIGTVSDLDRADQAVICEILWDLDESPWPADQEVIREVLNPFSYGDDDLLTPVEAIRAWRETFPRLKTLDPKPEVANRDLKADVQLSVWIAWGAFVIGIAVGVVLW